jgi:hypothetical protein
MESERHSRNKMHQYLRSRAQGRLGAEALRSPATGGRHNRGDAARGLHRSPLLGLLVLESEPRRSGRGSQVGDGRRGAPPLPLALRLSPSRGVAVALPRHQRPAGSRAPRPALLQGGSWTCGRAGVASWSCAPRPAGWRRPDADGWEGGEK